MLLQHKYKEKAKLSTVIIFIPHCASKNQKGSLRGEFLPQKVIRRRRDLCLISGSFHDRLCLGDAHHEFGGGQGSKGDGAWRKPGPFPLFLCKGVMSTDFKTLCVRAFQPNGCLHVFYSPSSRRTMLVLLETCPMRTTAQDKRQVLDP